MPLLRLCNGITGSSMPKREEKRALISSQPSLKEITSASCDLILERRVVLSRPGKSAKKKRWPASKEITKKRN